MRKFTVEISEGAELEFKGNKKRGIVSPSTPKNLELQVAE
jgi:hypothetical protein